MRLRWSWIAVVCQCVSLLAGDGKAAFEKVCKACHELEQVTERRHTKAGWEHVVDDMISKGAEGTGEQFDAIIDYLAEHYGAVNVNKLTAKELEESQVFSGKDADAIVQYRTGHGKFPDLEALKKVPGLDANKLEKKKDGVVF
jgi:competence protein ComEA